MNAFGSSISVTIKRHQTYQHSRFDSFAAVSHCVPLFARIPLHRWLRPTHSCFNRMFWTFSHVYRILARFVVILMLDTQNNRITTHSRWMLLLFFPPRRIEIKWNEMFIYRAIEWMKLDAIHEQKSAWGNDFWRRMRHSHAIHRAMSSKIYAHLFSSNRALSLCRISHSFAPMFWHTIQLTERQNIHIMCW